MYVYIFESIFHRFSLTEPLCSDIVRRIRGTTTKKTVNFLRNNNLCAVNSGRIFFL